MKTLDILVVEDEILIGESIKYLLEEKNHRVLDIAISYDETLKALDMCHPDLILLDIRLYGEKSGIDIANHINQHALDIPYVFLTSQYDSKILSKALSTSPYGYLTKPVQNESLYTTVQSAYHLFESRFEKKQKPLIIADAKSENKVDQHDILFIKSDHVYNHIYLKGNHELIVRQSLSSIQEKLDTEMFMQVHRSYIVNLKYIKSWNIHTAMLPGHEIPISRSKKHEFLERMEKLFHDE